VQAERVNDQRPELTRPSLPSFSLLDPLRPSFFAPFTMFSARGSRCLGQRL